MKYITVSVALLIGSLVGWFLNDLATAPVTQALAKSVKTISLTEEARPNPAYMIVLGTVHEREAFMQGYVAKLPPLYDQYGGRYIAIGGDHEVLEGETSFKSHVMSQWTNADAARAFWNSPEYAALKHTRIKKGWGDFDVFLVEGLPQPKCEADMPENAAPN